MADRSLPTEVPRSQAMAALESLGLDPSNGGILSVLFEPRAITVVQKRLNDKGHAFADGNQIATVTTKIGLTFDA